MDISNIKVSASSLFMQLSKIVAGKNNLDVYQNQINNHYKKVKVTISPATANPFEIHYNAICSHKEYQFHFTDYNAIKDLTTNDLKMLSLIIAFTHIDGYCEFDTSILTKLGIYKNQKDANRCFNKLLNKLKDIKISIILAGKKLFSSLYNPILDIISPVKNNIAIVEIPQVLVREFTYAEMYIPKKMFSLTDNAYYLFMAGILQLSNEKGKKYNIKIKVPKAINSMGLSDRSGKNPNSKYILPIIKAIAEINNKLYDTVQVRSDEYGANYHNDEQKYIHYNFTDSYIDHMYTIENIMMDGKYAVCYSNNRAFRSIIVSYDQDRFGDLSGIPLTAAVNPEYSHRLSICGGRINTSDQIMTERFLRGMGITNNMLLDHLLDHKNDLTDYICKIDFTDHMINVIGMSSKEAYYLQNKLMSRILRCKTTLLLAKVTEDKDINIKQIVNYLYKKYHNDIFKTLMDKPFEIGHDIFNGKPLLEIKAQISIARMNPNIKANDPRLLAAYAEYIITDHLISTGSTAILFNDYKKEYAQISDNISASFTDLEHKRYIKAAGGIIAVLKGNVYVASNDTFNKEMQLAEMLCTLVNKPNPVPYISPSIIHQISTCLGFVPDKEQIDALSSVYYTVSVITGGPGSGKTSVVKAINKAIDILSPGSHKIFCAPTARAAKRMNQAASINAKTVQSYVKSLIPNNSIPDYLIIDEASMCDLKIAYDVFSAAYNAINSGRDTHIIIIGDPDQLPSVEYGNVLNDLIDSGIVPVFKLTNIHRFSASTIIVTNASKVLAGDSNLAEDYINNSFRLYKEGSTDEAIKTIMELSYSTKDNHPMESCQIISPIKDSALGVDYINNVVRKIYNPNAKMVYFGKQRYAIGDKVILNKNNRKLGYINGDMGIVTKVSKEEMSINVDGKNITLPKSLYKNVSLAYCLTVHKMQGSEADNIIIALPKSLLTDRNMLYTALTRAKKRVNIVFIDDALEEACLRKTERITLLKEHILHCMSLVKNVRNTYGHYKLLE